MSCTRRLAAGLSPQRPGFDAMPVDVRLVGYKVAQGTGFSPNTSVSLVSIIAPKLHTPLHLHVAVIRTTNMHPENVTEIGEHRKEKYFRFLGCF